MNLNFWQKSAMLQKLCRQYFSTFWSLCFCSVYPVHKRQGKDLISPFFSLSLMHRESPRPGSDLNASLRDLLELDHIAQPRLAQSSPFCLPSSASLIREEQKLHKHRVSE